jgi:hypothetical protein
VGAFMPAQATKNGPELSASSHIDPGRCGGREAGSSRRGPEPAIADQVKSAYSWSRFRLLRRTVTLREYNTGAQAEISRLTLGAAPATRYTNPGNAARANPARRWRSSSRCHSRCGRLVPYSQMATA